MPFARARGTAGVALALAVALLVIAPSSGAPLAAARGATGPTEPAVVATADPASGPAPLSVDLRANGSGGFGPYTFSWDFGDGSAGGSGASTTHVYDRFGNYTAVVTLTDYYGATATSSVLVTVAPPPLSVSVIAQPSTVTLDAAALLETTILGGVAPYTIVWSGLPPGCPSESVENYSCQPTAAGNYTLTATVTDARGTTASGSAPLSVLGPTTPPTTPAPPPAAAPPSPDLPLALAAIALIAVAIGLAVALLRRRRNAGDGPGARP